MFKIIKKNITTVTEGIVAHGCNLVPVMGAGIALAIAKTWPYAEQEYKEYVLKHKDKKALLGTTQFVTINDKLLIANCFTQIGTGFDRFGNPPAQLDAIRSSLRHCLFVAAQYDLDLYTPQIGCGLGGLDWDSQVKPIYEELASEIDIDSNNTWYVCTVS